MFVPMWIVWAFVAVVAAPVVLWLAFFGTIFVSANLAKARRQKYLDLAPGQGGTHVAIARQDWPPLD